MNIPIHIRIRKRKSVINTWKENGSEKGKKTQQTNKHHNEKRISFLTERGTKNN